MREKRLKRSLAGLLSLVMILTTMTGNITLAADGTAADNGVAAVSELDDKNTAAAGQEDRSSDDEKAAEEQTKETPEEQKPEAKPTEQPQVKEEKQAPADAASPAFNGTYEDGNVKVSAAAAEEILPEGTVLVVKEITEENELQVLTEKMVAEAEARDKVITGFGLYDIGFEVNGTKIEPNGDVKISAEFKKPIESAGEQTTPEVMVVHMPDDGTSEVVDAQAQTGDKVVEKVEFQNDSFSPVAIMAVENEDTTVYSYTTPLSGGKTDDIELTKTVKDITEKGSTEQTLEIDLGVKGLSFTETSPVDITFVVDLSNSMTNSGSKNLDYTKAAIDKFVETVGSNTGVRFGLVAYGSKAKAFNFGKNKWIRYANLSSQSGTFYTSSADEIKNIVDEKSFKPGMSAEKESDDGGTNTEGGFLAAQKVTAKRESNAQSIVIFMTDGVPAFRYKDDGSATDDDSGTTISNAKFNEAVTAAKGLKAAGNSIYTVGLLTSYADPSDSLTCANYLLSDQYSYKRSGTIYTKNGAPYSSGYFKVTKSDTDAGSKLAEIYEQIANETLFLAEGTVTDVLPEGFELVSADGWSVGADGKALTYTGVKAGPQQTKLPTIKVKYTGNDHGAAYTNSEAVYAGELYDGSSFTKEFAQPTKAIVAITSKAVLEFKKVTTKGEALEGARFALYEQTEDGGKGNMIQETASTADGTVRFKELTLGTYILEETEAPEGYRKSDVIWIVKVERNEESEAIAVLYQADGETPVEAVESQIRIQNITEEEWIRSKMDFGKTTAVKDWNDRIYDININAASKVIKSSTEVSGGKVNAMLVLDRSGSMGWTEDGDSSSRTEVRTKDNKGGFNNVKGILDTTKVYLYNWLPMAYINGRWQYYESSSGKWEVLSNSSTEKIYTCDDRLSGLKEAANAFTLSMAASSPESKLGVAMYNNSASTLIGLSPVGTSQSNILKSINRIYSMNETDPGSGLREALLQFDNDKDGVPQYVILFTDGEPDPKSNETYAEEQAEKLRAKGVKIYTIGFALNNTTKTWLEEKIADPGCAKTAEDIEELKKIFEEIQQTITENVAIGGAEIKDVVDSRFVILDDNSKAITEDYPGIKNGIKLANGGTVYYEADGTQVIKWTDQTIPNKAEGNWSRTFTVKAKEDYIGGNNVPTNITPDSVIHTGYGDAVLPQPAVNVKGSLTVGNVETTIFWGDNVPGDQTTLDQLFDQAGINTEYEGVDKSKFAFQWYTDEPCAKPVSAEDMRKIKPDDTVSFYLKVTYDAGEPTEESTKATGGNIAGGGEHLIKAENSDTAKYPGKEYGVYRVNIVKGQLTITKKIDEQYTNIKQINANQSFIFKIERRDTPDGAVKDVYYEVLNFEANNDLSTRSSTITGLKKGYYTVTEETEWSAKYTLENVSNNYSADSNVKDQASVKDLYIGKLLHSTVSLSGVDSAMPGDIDSRPEFYGLEQNTYDAYARGVGAETEFSNTAKADWKYLSDTASAVNRFTK